MRKLLLIFLLASFSAAGQSPMFKLLGKRTVYLCPDADAQAFIDSAGITDTTQKRAICELVTDLKGYSIWTKFAAIYPIIGGTAATHKWNLKDPRNLDAAFRLDFVGGIVHSNTGIAQTTGGYGNTFYIPSVNGTPSSMALSYYSRTNVAGGARHEIGAWNISPERIMGISVKQGDGIAYGQMDLFAGNASAANANTTGFYTVSRTSTTSNTLYKNGVSIGTNVSSTASSRPTVSFYVMGLNKDGVSDRITLTEMAFATISTGLNSTEAANLYTAVQKYQTTLGRQL